MSKSCIGILFSIFYISMHSFLHAQIVSTNCFLKGNYVHLGINNCGAYGSNGAPPTGYSYNVYSGLGFTADNALDGWSTGWPSYCGDYFVPGSPVEGWGIQIGSSLKKYNTDQYCYYFDIPGSVIGYDYVAGVYTAIWEGDFIAGSYDLHFKQETILKEDETYFVTRITITNNATTAVSDLYYMRNVDPDQDQPWSYDFTTYNEVINQPPTDDQALVTSEGLTYGCFLGLGSKDPNSRVTWGNFSTNTYGAKAVYNGTSGYYQSGSMTSDIANSIAFYIASLAAGESHCLAFAYVLDASDIDEALDNTLPVSFTVGGVPVTSGDTIMVSPGVPIDLAVVGYAGYSYTWSPSSTLSSSSGETVSATIYSTTTYTIDGTGEDCGNLTGTLTLIPTVLPVEITYLSANCVEDVVELQWETASEMSSESFLIERSTNGKDFTTLAEIPAAGYSTSVIQYKYIDEHPAAETNYYRLKQTDLQGEFEYTDVIEATCENFDSELDIITATLHSDAMQISVQVPHSGNYIVELAGIKGQTLLFRNIYLQEGLHQLQIPHDGNVSKEYYLAVVTDKTNGEQTAKKIIAE